MIQSMALALICAISGKGAMRAGKRQEGVTSIASNDKRYILKKELQDQEEEIVTWIIWVISFSSAPSFKQYRDY